MHSFKLNAIIALSCFFSKAVSTAASQTYRSVSSNSTTINLTTPDIPPQFLEYAGFVGDIPRRILPADPRLSFSLYIPPRRYNPDPKNTSYTLPKLPLVVSVHGTGRNLAEAGKGLQEFAEEMHCAVLIPLFPAGLTSSFDVDSYKLSNATQLRADLALIDMLDEIQYRWPGVETDKVFLMGFSGGGQFVHRFLYLHPHRLAAACVGSPGHVTYIDDTQTWPRGTADISTTFDVPLDLSEIVKVPIQLIVGSDDNKADSPGDFWDWVHGTLGEQEDLMPREKGRLDTLRDLKGNWDTNGVVSTFEAVENVGHESDGIRETVLAWLGPLLKQS